MLTRSRLYFFAALLLGVVLWPLSADTEEVPTDLILRVETGMHTAPIRRLGLSSDGRFVATASDDKTVRVWSLPNGELVETFRGPMAEGLEGSLGAAAFTPSGTLLLAGGATGFTWDDEFSVYVFDFPEGKIKGRRITNIPGKIVHLTYQKDEAGQTRSLAIAFTSDSCNGLFIYDNKARRIAEDMDFQEAPHWVEFSKDGRMVATSADGDIRLYDPDLHLLKRIPAPDGKIPYAARFSPDGGRIAVGYRDASRVDVLSAEDLSLQTRLTGPEGASHADLSGRTQRQEGLYAVTWVAGASLDIVAGGNVSTADGTYLVRWWSGGFSQKDIAISRDVITDLQATQDGKVIFASADPQWGVIAPTGEVVLRRVSGAPDFRNIFRGAFGVSEDGMIVDFAIEQDGRTPFRFDLRNGQLVSDPAPDPKIRPPLLPTRSIPVDKWWNGREPVIGTKRLPLAVSEVSRSVTLHPDRKRFLLGADHHIYLFDRNGRELAQRQIPATAWGVTVSGDGRRAVAALGDGTLRWYDLEPGRELEELAALFVHRDGVRWVAWTPEGFFDHAARGGQQLAGYHVNMGAAESARWIDFKALYDLFYKPELVVKKVAGGSSSEIARELAQIGTVDTIVFNHPAPMVELSDYCVPRPNATGSDCFPAKTVRRGLVRTDASAVETAQKTPAGGYLPEGTERILLRFAVTDAGDGVKEVDIHLNDRIQGPETRGLQRRKPAPTVVPDQQATTDGASMVLTHQVNLVPGENRIFVRAYNHYGVFSESEKIELIVQQSLPPEKPDLYVLAVGINDYGGDIPPLKYAVADAQSFVAVLRDHKPSSYDEFKATELFNDRATRSNLRQALAELANQVKKDDAMLIYLAGHGIFDNTNNLYYFVTQDVSSVGAVTEEAVDQQQLLEWVTRIPGARKFLFLDTCHSGVFSMEAAGKINNRTGYYVLAASAKTGEALDGYTNQNGLFAHAVLQGLKGEAGKSGVVEALSLGGYVVKNVPVLARNKKWDQKAEFKASVNEVFDLTQVQ